MARYQEVPLAVPESPEVLVTISPLVGAVTWGREVANDCLEGFPGCAGSSWSGADPRKRLRLAQRFDFMDMQTSRRTRLVSDEGHRQVAGEGPPVKYLRRALRRREAIP